MAEITKTDAEWKAELSPEAYQVLRCHGTEPAGSSPLNTEKRDGMFYCAGCGQVLFSSQAKYDSGSGWPSFYAAEGAAITTIEDRSHGMVRTEVRCAKCDGHLGHLFPDGPRPTGERYCMNGLALRFAAKETT